MDTENLKKNIEELKDEISRLQNEAPETAVRLQQLVDNMEQTIDSDELNNNDLVAGIQKNIEHLETEHPSATEILNRIATVLSNMGI